MVELVVLHNKITTPIKVHKNKNRLWNYSIVEFTIEYSGEQAARVKGRLYYERD